MGQNWDNMTQFLSHFDSEKILSEVTLAQQFKKLDFFTYP